MEFQNVKAACKSGGESAKQLPQLHHQAHDDADEGKHTEGDSNDFRPILRAVGSGSVAIHPLVPRPLRFRAAAMIMPHTSAEAVLSGGWNSRFHGFFNELLAQRFILEKSFNEFSPPSKSAPPWTGRTHDHGYATPEDGRHELTWNSALQESFGSPETEAAGAGRELSFHRCSSRKQKEGRKQLR
jgi:hypothetical protein